MDYKEFLKTRAVELINAHTAHISLVAAVISCNDGRTPNTLSFSEHSKYIFESIYGESAVSEDEHQEDERKHAREELPHPDEEPVRLRDWDVDWGGD